MLKPIQYRLYKGWLWVRAGQNEVWTKARKTNSKRLTPITQSFGQDFIYTGQNTDWKGKWFYKEIIGTLQGHNGIDWEAPTNTCLYATFDGTITEVRDDNYGKSIRLKNNQYEVVFGHLMEQYCMEGDNVTQGQLIGLCDNTGLYTTGSHLHEGVRPTGYDRDNGYYGYIDHKKLIENLEIWEFPYIDGQCLMRTEAQGQFYVYENGDLVYLDSEKQRDKHIPLVDYFIKQRSKGLPKDFIKPITEKQFEKYNYLIR